MKNINNYETNLILKQLKNTASEDEKFRFSEWLKSSPENKNTFGEISNLWEATEDPARKFDPDIAFSWEKVRLEANVEERENIRKAPVRKLMTSVLLIKIAASIILLLGIGWFLNTRFFTQTEMITLKTSQEQKLFILPDSSKVLLNKNSSISFIKGFDDSKREIKLEGEAFFEVKKDSLHPFSVTGLNAKITVLGTSFNAHMDKLNNKAEVEVLTGKVLFEDMSHPDYYVILTSGYKASLLANGNIVKDIAENTNALAWKGHQFNFRNTKLLDVVENLQKHFEVQIEIQNPKIKNCRYTGSFDNPTIREIIETITASMDLSYQEKEGKYILKGGSCP